MNKKLYKTIIRNISKSIKLSLNENDLFDDDLVDTNDNTDNVVDKLGISKFVDLGLKSGTLWCDRNLGAYRPEDSGLFYLWGDINGYTDDTQHQFNNKGYKFRENKQYTKYVTNLAYGIKDNKKVLDIEDDAANAYDSNICMPTKELFEELFSNCKITTVTIDHNNVVKFTSKRNGNSIIFPVCGCYYNIMFRMERLKGRLDENVDVQYWSSNLDTTGTNKIANACTLMLRCGYYTNAAVLSCNRATGNPIRPVLNK